MNGCCHCCQSEVHQLFPLAASARVVDPSVELICSECLDLIEDERNTLIIDFSVLVVSPAYGFVGLVA